MIATTMRVLRQLRHDPRTIALLVVIPSLLMILLRYMLDSERAFAQVAPALLGIFPFLLMFLVTSIATLRERASGTLERLMTTPLAKVSLLGGYGLAFAAVALVQVGLTLVTATWLGLDIEGSIGWLIGVTTLDALLGVALGLLASAFAHTEFQAIQLMPVVVLPQLLLCGLFQPRSEMATVLRWASDVLPVSYAVDALRRVSTTSLLGASFVRDVVVLIAFVVGAISCAAATLRRRTP